MQDKDIRIKTYFIFMFDKWLGVQIKLEYMDAMKHTFFCSFTYIFLDIFL